MGIIQSPSVLPGQVGVIGAIKYMVTTDSLATITTAGYLNSLDLAVNPILASDVLGITYSYNLQSNSGTFDLFSVSISNGVITIVPNTSSVTLPTIANHIATYTNTSGGLSEDPATAISGGNIQAGLSGTAGTLASFPGTAANGKFIFAAINNTGNFNSTISNSNVGQAVVYSLPDPSAATSNIAVTGGALVSGNLVKASGTAGVVIDSGIVASTVIINNVAAGQTISSTQSSATPGTVRTLVGSMTASATTLTSGNLVGVRGVLNMVGSSTSFYGYGVQGKIIATGTLASGQFQAGVFGQLDISAATINAGQLAPIWGDYGTSSGTLTDQTGLYGIAMTNTTAAVLQGQLYLYGGAQNLMYLSTNAGLSGVTYFKNAGTGSGSWGNATPPTPSKVLKISVDGTAYYLPLVAQNT